MANDNETYPKVGDKVSFVLGSLGRPVLCPAEVVATDPDTLSLRLELPQTQIDELPIGRALTIVYDRTEYTFSMRGTLTGISDNAVIDAAPSGAPVVGEQREFLRADLELPCAVLPLPTDTSGNIEAAVAHLKQSSSKPGDYELFTSQVNLSGSGVAFYHTTKIVSPDNVAIALLLPTPGEPSLIKLPAQVVRSWELTAAESDRYGTSVHHTAFEFTSVDEDALDMMVSTVFALCFLGT